MDEKKLLRRALEFIPVVQTFGGPTYDVYTKPDYTNEIERLRYEADKLERAQLLRDEIIEAINSTRKP